MSGFPGLIPQLRPWAQGLYLVASRNGLRPRVTSTFRSISEQSALRRRYLRGESRFPAAPAGRSLHNFGHAFDLVTDVPGGQEWLGAVWKHWGGRWGGDFSDPIHFDTGVTIP